MQLALLSDVHGNLPALESVLRDIDRHDVDGVIVAGDLTGGPQQVEVIDRLRSITEWIIRGNNEDYLLAYRAGEVPPAWWTSEQWAMMRWSYEQLDAETLDFIAALPHQRVIEFDRLSPVRVLHGSPRSPSEHLFPDQDPEAMAVFRWAGMLPAEQEPVPLEAALGGIAEPVVVCGHSHIPWQQALPNQLVINPGSAGAANNGDHRAQYALLTEEAGRVRVTFRAVAYDLDRIRAAYEGSGLLAEGGGFAQARLRGIETGRNVPLELVTHAYQVAVQAGYEEEGILPDEIWRRAVESFCWE
jgi:predicted phosphodiesterase